jgi:hypothetical protein
MDDDYHGGPSPSVIAWRRFVIETVLCLVLLGAIVVIALGARHILLAGPAIIALSGAILGILWHGSDRHSKNPRSGSPRQP